MRLSRRIVEGGGPPSTKGLRAMISSVSTAQCRVAQKYLSQGGLVRRRARSNWTTPMTARMSTLAQREGEGAALVVRGEGDPQRGGQDDGRPHQRRRRQAGPLYLGAERPGEARVLGRGRPRPPRQPAQRVGRRPVRAEPRPAPLPPVWERPAPPLNAAGVPPCPRSGLNRGGAYPTFTAIGETPRVTGLSGSAA